MSIRIGTLKQPIGTTELYSPDFGLYAPMDQPAKSFIAPYTREAPPFYQTLTIQKSGSGSRSIDYGLYVLTQNFDYDTTETFTRAPLWKYKKEDNPFSLLNNQTTLDALYPTLVQELSLNGTNDFLLYMDLNPFRSYFGVPYLKRHYLIAKCIKSIAPPPIDGTETVEYADMPELNYSTDIVGYSSSFGGVWFYTPYEDEPETPSPKDLPTRIRLGDSPESLIPEFSLPVSSVVNWRDLRGEYEKTFYSADYDSSWDSNSVQHSIKVTFS